MSKTYMIISDLHMSDGSENDRFYGDGTRLIDHIKDINPDVLILAGDIMELWDYKFKVIRKAHKKLWDFFDEKKAIRLKGNHDYTLFGKNKYVFEKDGKTYYVAHGHQRDKDLAHVILRFFSWVIGQVQKIFPKVENIFSKNKTFSGYENAKRFAAIILKKKKYDHVILGHTHKNEIHVLGPNGGIYYNCGSCSKGQVQYTLI